MEKLLNQKQLAERLNVSPLTIARMTKNGEITPIYVRPRCPRFLLPDVLKEIKQNQEQFQEI